MSYKLRKGISFCRTGDRFVFLDLRRDRYFCLAPAADQAFGQLVENGQGVGADLELARLARNGLLVEAADAERPRHCVLPRSATISLLDNPNVLVRWHHVTEALIARAIARVRLALFGLEPTLRREVSAARSAFRLPAAENAILIAAALAKSSAVVGSRDKCLYTSLAAAAMLRARNVPALIILGVKLRPFQAHCWVQVDDAVVTDRLDVVRNFAPIWVG